MLWTNMMNVIGGIILIIGVSTALFAGSQILDSSSQTFDCSTVEGYNPFIAKKSTGWAKVCLDAQEQGRHAFAIIVAIPAFGFIVAVVGVLRHYSQ